MEKVERSPGLVERSEWAPWTLLMVGVLAASVSAILIRYATGIHPFAISFWRCAAGAAVLAPFARRGFRGTAAASLNMPMVAGVFLALHFGTWITSLEYTTVAASVLLVSTTPIFVGLGAWLLLGERLVQAAWLGILLAFAGTALIGGGDLSGSNLLGDLLALAGGATAGGYVLAGQVARREMGIFEYSVVTYAVAAILLLVACLLVRAPLGGYSSPSWLALAGLIVGPQLLGHTVLNLVLKDIGATTVSVAIMAEPLIATWLAFILFDEVPSLLIYPAGAAILIGIYLVSTARREPVVIVE